MFTKYTHFGLIFTAQDVKNAQTYRDQPPYSAAWSQFEAMQLDAHMRRDAVSATAYDALRWRLSGDSDAGARAIDGLAAHSALDEPVSVSAGRRLFALIQAFECVRDHPAYTQTLVEQVRALLPAWALTHEAPSVTPSPSEWAWLYAVRLAVGVAFDDDKPVESTASDVRVMIESIHPAGFLRGIIEAKPEDPSSLFDTLQAVHGLALAAEVAAHAGIDLWAHEKRSVSLMTAAFYPLYYYYYPEKWKWGAGVTLDTVQGWFKAHAGFLEIINRRRQNVRAVNMILGELRPVLDLTGGGALTLTHHPAPPVKRGWFGR